MKKNTIRILLAVSAVFLVISCLSLYFTFPILMMKPTPTGLISGTNVFSIKNSFGAVFFIKTQEGYIQIDAGSDVKSFSKSLKEANINANDVKLIFLTHSDYDHIAALPTFTNAIIYMSEDELPLVNGSKKRSFSGGNTLPPGIDLSKIVLLQDNEEISLNGIVIKCIKAPGHTPGSMMYLIDGKYLFSGDAFKYRNGVKGIHPFTMDSKQAKKTMERLKETLEKHIVFTSHCGYFGKLY